MRDTSLSWQKKLARGFSSATELLNFLELQEHKACVDAETLFPTRVPLEFAQRMQKGNPNDPLLLQILAAQNELIPHPDYQSDPLVELSVNPLKGLIHKYQSRVLLTLTGVCAVNCRFCFRRHFPYQENNPGRKGWEDVCDYISKDPNITEVILSGGDPLLASDKIFIGLIEQLEQIPHLHTLRIHTRIPIVFPDRVDKDFLALLAATRFHKVIVLHCNHPQELDKTVKQVCAELNQIGCTLLNQSVLLTGINDDSSILAQLSQTLFSYGVLPYYLHLLDKVKGTAHFDMPCSKAQEIFTQLQRILPGYLVPRLVRDEAGKTNKTLII